MTRTLLFLIVAALFIAVGRVTIPGHGLTGWPGLYEALAHLLLGAMIAVAFLRDGVVRHVAVTLVIALTLFEVAMFKIQNP